jgi:hypothetical protein
MAANRMHQPQSRVATDFAHSALSYSRAIEPQLNTEQIWWVLSVHPHACNLHAATGELMALVSPRHGNGPFHLVLPVALYRQLAVHDEVQLTCKRLCWGQTRIDLQSAQCWEPVVQWPQNPLSLVALSILLHEKQEGSPSWFLDKRSAPLAFTKRAGQATQALLAGVQWDDHSQLRLGAQLLAGLGPGLTPAGDDFLLGWMAGSYLCTAGQNSHAPAHAGCASIATVARGNTTRLSAAWLAYAAQGAFGAPWHKLADSLQTAKPQPIDHALQLIAGSGATSGHDALAGLHWALVCYGR